MSRHLPLNCMTTSMHKISLSSKFFYITEINNWYSLFEWQKIYMPLLQFQFLFGSLHTISVVQCTRMSDSITYKSKPKITSLLHQNMRKKKGKKNLDKLPPFLLIKIYVSTFIANGVYMFVKKIKNKKWQTEFQLPYTFSLRCKLH